MWLKLNLDGIELNIEIKGYQNSTYNNWDDEWCTVKINVQSENWLNYSQSGDLLLACEVEEILSMFEDLKKDKIPESREVEFIEPDIKFVLNPKKDLRDDPRFTYVKPGCEIVDINAEIRVSFWNAGLTANYLSLSMDEEDISAFIIYLKVITKRISKKDEDVHALLQKGILLEC